MGSVNNANKNLKNKSKVDNDMIRTRFAPSPTGYLHIGGARTALFSWLYARHYQGQFILRIEDTDQQRSTQAAVDAIIDGMNWLGLDYDEGPVFQMERMHRYRQVISQLFDAGKVYCCYCSKERLQDLRETQMANKRKPRYDGHCRDLPQQTNDKPYVLRFKNPTSGIVAFNDLVRGRIEFANDELDDLIIQRSDGSPTYNFTVIVDDWDMNITTVIRGDDHINNTPRQINLLQALQVPLPQYAHVPMILGSDGKRLSKRHGAMSVTEYREKGFLPEALLNYLVRLGWSHGDSEIFSKMEMIDLFDINAVNRAAATFNDEKLSWLNQHYLKTENSDYIAGLLRQHFQQRGIDTNNGPKLTEVVLALRERSKTLVEMAGKAECFYQPVMAYDEKVVNKFFKADIVPALAFIKVELAKLNDWSEESINHIVQVALEKFSLKMPQLAQPLRIALTGNTQSPSIGTTIYLIGQLRVQCDLAKAIQYIDALSS